MTPAEIRAVRQQLGLTQGQAGRLFGVDPRAWRRIEAGTLCARGPLLRLLCLAAALPGTLATLYEIAETKDHSPCTGPSSSP